MLTTESIVNKPYVSKNYTQLDRREKVNFTDIAERTTNVTKQNQSPPSGGKNSDDEKYLKISQTDSMLHSPICGLVFVLVSLPFFPLLSFLYPTFLSSVPSLSFPITIYSTTLFSQTEQLRLVNNERTESDTAIT
jgi:hypothetical protein